MSQDATPSNDEKGAAVKFPPLLILLLSIFVAYGVDYFKPITIGASSTTKFIGILITLIATGLTLYISLIFSRAKTSIKPWKPTSTIITSGIYGYSRNPIYVLFCFISLGIGIALDSFWVIGSFIPSAVLIYFFAIKKEERYLEKKFGEEYLQYKKKVRRWL